MSVCACVQSACLTFFIQKPIVAIAEGVKNEKKERKNQQRQNEKRKEIAHTHTQRYATKQQSKRKNINVFRFLLGTFDIFCVILLNEITTAILIICIWDVILAI